LSRFQESTKTRGLAEAMLEGELAFTSLFVWSVVGMVVSLVTVQINFPNALC